jgi:hypothetical protein
MQNSVTPLQQGDFVLYKNSPVRIVTILKDYCYGMGETRDLGSVEVYSPTVTRLNPKDFHSPAWRSLMFHNPRIGLSGTDPEIFAFDATGQVVPSFTYLHSKAVAIDEYNQTSDSVPLPPLSGPVFWDGFQGEMAPPPCACHEVLIARIGGCLRKMAERLPLGAYLQTADVVEIPLEVLQEAPSAFVEFGCSPSLNAYGDDLYPRIHFSDPYQHRLRYSGCHLHFSWGLADIPAPPWYPDGTVMMMDKVLGILLTAFGRGLEDPRRRVAYGRPGEYRLPGPGRLEYRTPGSFLLRNPRIFNFALDVGRWAFGMGLRYDGRRPDFLSEAHQIIACADADAACQYIKQHWDLFKAVMAKLYGSTLASQALYLVMEGAQASGMTEGPLLPRWSSPSTYVKSFSAQLMDQELA